MKKIIGVTLISLSYFSPHAQTKWNLKKCIEYGFTSNASMKQNEIQAKIAEGQYNQSKNDFLPTLNLSFAPGLSFGRSPVSTSFTYTTQTLANSNANTNVNLLVFDGNKRKLNTLIYKQNWQTSLLQNEKLKNDMTLTIISYYLQALLSKEQIAIANLQLNTTNSQIKNTQALVKAGIKSETDLGALQTQFAKDSFEVIIANNTSEVNLFNLKNYLSIDPAVAFEIETIPIENIATSKIGDLDPEGIFQLAVSNQPLLKINDFKKNTELLNLKMTKASLKPTVSLNLGLSTDYNQILSGAAFSKTPFFLQVKNNFRQFANASISIPIFDAFKTKTAISRSKYNLENLMILDGQDRLKLKQDVYKAYLDVIAAFNKYNAAEITVRAAENSLSLFQKRYSLGLVNTIDLITSEIDFYKAKQESILSHFDYVFKTKILEFYKGEGLIF